MPLQILDVIHEVAIRAGALAYKMRQDGVSPHSKGTFDIVTEADYASQNLILESLEASFPGVPVVAEEGKDHLISSGTFFTVDPIDGTALYNQGGKDWGILIGFIENGKPAAGVIHVPERGTTVVAAAGKGAFINGQALKLKQRPLKQAILGTEYGWWVKEQYLMNTLPLLAKSCPGIRSILGSAGSGIDLLTGATDAYIHFGGAKIWDFVPVVIAVQEAGGGYVRLNGDEAVWDSIPYDGIFFSHLGIKDEILSLIKTSLALGQ